ncbi:MAG: ATP-binding cassette domain-containing protein [Candidatus Magnetominusculus sp. LBB02]|nr:ATP-binding cassette domain-containing protein [Candidatus Magnetominusculus sp. LBB02]
MLPCGGVGQDAIFELTKAGVIRKGQPLLSEISLSIFAGQHTAIVGPNGAGKTTLMRLLTGDTFASYKDNGSSVKLFGQTRYSVWDVKKRIGIITNDLDEQHKVHAAHMTGIEVALTGLFDSIGYLPLDGLTRQMKDKAYELMKRLNIHSLCGHAFCNMSSGEARQCLIARALISEPEVMMLDEPTTGLDIAAQFSFFDLMTRISDNYTVILITHHIEEILPFIRNIVMIKNGRIFMQGPKDQLLTGGNLSALFGVRLDVHMDRNGIYHILRGSQPI